MVFRKEFWWIYGLHVVCVFWEMLWMWIYVTLDVEYSWINVNVLEVVIQVEILEWMDIYMLKYIFRKCRQWSLETLMLKYRLNSTK
jgi:hypothetical protein